MSKWLIGIVLLLASIGQTFAQEFTTQVTINTPKIQTVDPKVFRNLETAIEEFMNTRDWIEDEFEPTERIELNIIITIESEKSQTEFTGQMTIQASRPVYGSGYNSVLFQNLDKEISFSYGEFEVLDFSENTYTSNLTSTLAFYAYIILGMDYDSFSELGGEEHIQKAQDILNTVPRGTNSGWIGGNNVIKRNRYWLVENLLNPRMQDMRRAMYQYYMLGLDRIAQEDKTEKGLSSILKALEAVQNANQNYLGNMWVQLFTDSKRDEVINLFKITDINTKRKVYQMMVKMDGTHAVDYRVLLK
jgi:hypothetical protein